MITEKDIQEHIWCKKDDWVDLLVKPNIPECESFLDTEYDIYSLTPYVVIKNRVFQRLKYLFSYTCSLNLIGCEVRLRKEGDSTIRADFIAKPEGFTGLAIIELKKSKQTERQAFTELLGYANHITSIFPSMSQDDIGYILISPMEERIVREATIFSLLTDEKNIFALIPSFENDDLTTLKLVPWIPNEKDITSITESAFSGTNIDIFKLTWSKLPDWNVEKLGKNPESYMIERMEKVSQYAAQTMEAKKISGFVYCGQYWAEIPFLTNFIVIGALNPYKVGLRKYALTNQIEDESSVLLKDIFPELVNDNSDEFELDSLINSWSNTITKIAFDTVDKMTLNRDNLTIQKEWATFTWDLYQKIITEDIICHNFNICLTGLFRQIFTDYSKIDLEFISKFGTDKHPNLSHGDVSQFFVDLWGEQWYVRAFIERLFNPFEGFDDSFDEIDL